MSILNSMAIDAINHASEHHGYKFPSNMLQVMSTNRLNAVFLFETEDRHTNPNKIFAEYRDLSALRAERQRDSITVYARPPRYPGDPNPESQHLEIQFDTADQAEFAFEQLCLRWINSGCTIRTVPRQWLAQLAA